VLAPVITVTLAVVPAARLGAVAVHWLPVVLQLTLLAGVVPKLTPVTPVRFVPWSVTDVPAGPLEGLMLASVGTVGAVVEGEADGVGVGAGVGVGVDASEGAVPKLSVCC
jgi:hypothetical protein